MMSRITYTVVVWSEGDKTARPVGPTSNDRDLLRPTLRTARELYHDAEIVEWARRDDTVSQIVALRTARHAEQQAITAAMDLDT